MLLVIGVFVFLIWKRFRSEDRESVIVPSCLVGFPLLLHVATYPGMVEMDNSALILLVASWSGVTALVIFTVLRMLKTPARPDDGFIEDHKI
jgi:hypothetical protein